MNDFEFSLPTRIVFGRGAENRLAEFSARYGTRVMLLYGSARIRRSGLYRSLASQLEAEGITVIPFGDIGENPTLAKAEEGCRLAREHNVTLLLAVGGGSVIDMAKAVALGACHRGALWPLYEGKARAETALPIGVVLTTAATASEANCVSVLRNEAENRKCALRSILTFPKFALMNPELTYTVPAVQTAAGAVDIFSHSFERYFHKQQEGTLRTQLCVGVMKTVIKELPHTLRSPENYDARSQLMWAATVAHSDMLGFEGDFACHALSHILTGKLGLSHGVALGILMVAWCKFMLAEEPEAIAQFSILVWQIADTGDRALTAQNGISAFQSFLCSANLPVTLREAGFPHVSTEHLTDLALPDPDGFLGGNFHRLYRSDVLNILQLAKG